MKLLFENWNMFLNEGRRKELWQAMVDAAPEGEWWKLPYTSPERKAYRGYLDSHDGKGGPLVPPASAEEEDWECVEGHTGPDCHPTSQEPDPGKDACEDCELIAVYPYQDSNIPMSCVEYWWFDKRGNRISKASRHCGVA
jgi:hypothetical protein